MKVEQDFKNHVRYHPIYHFGMIPLGAILVAMSIYLAYDSLPDYPYKVSRFAQRYNQKYQPSIHRAELVPKHAHTYLQEYQTKVPAI